jgi:hypothetical protein
MTSRKLSWGRALEWILALIGSIVCVYVPGIFAISELSIPSARFMDILPFPGLYFVEITVLGLVCLYVVYRDEQNVNSKWNSVPWVCAGILLSFVILGAWTIGFFLIPAFLAFAILGYLIDKRKKGDFALHVIYLIAAGIAQSAVVFLAVSFVQS